MAAVGALVKGLKSEFQRFRTIVLANFAEAEMRSAEQIYMSGAVATSARILDALGSDMPENRKCALLRRISRECLAFQQSFNSSPVEEPPNV